MNAIKRAAALLGQLGGKVRSRAKTIACRRNAKLPRKKKKWKAEGHEGNAEMEAVSNVRENGDVLEAGGKERSKRVLALDGA